MLNQTKPDPVRSPLLDKARVARHPPRLFHPRWRRLRRHLPRPQHRHRLGRRPGTGAREPPPRRRLDGRAGRPSADRAPDPFARCRRCQRAFFAASGPRPTPSSPTGRASPSAPPPPIADRSCSPMPRRASSAPRMPAGKAPSPACWKTRLPRWKASAPSREHIVAVLGPSIGPENYEVGPEFVARFVDADAGNARYFAPSATTGHAMFDLNLYTVDRLDQGRRDRPRGSAAAPTPRKTFSTPTGAPRTARKRITGDRFQQLSWRMMMASAFRTLGI